MIHLPIRFKRGEFIYNLIKIYDGGFGLYENNKTGTKECFTPHQIGTLEEEIKTVRHSSKYDVNKYNNY